MKPCQTKPDKLASRLLVDWLTTDGFKPYPEALSVVFQSENRSFDHAAVVKTYGKLKTITDTRLARSLT